LDGEGANKNTGDLQGKNARQLQCKALRRRKKGRERRNNGEQWKKTGRRTMETGGIPGAC
jgi:hypothetical protein